MIPNCHNCKHRYRLHNRYGFYSVTEVCEANEIPNTVNDSPCDHWSPAPIYFLELGIGLLALAVLGVIIWALFIPFAAV